MAPMLLKPKHPPWSWSVAELGAQLTAGQRSTLLARFRALGFKVTAWSELVEAPPWWWTVRYLGTQLTEPQRQTLLSRFRALGFKVTTWQEPAKGGTS